MKALIAAVVLLSGCASLQASALPQAGNALLGVSAFYAAVCAQPAPLPENEQVCEQVKPELNEVIRFYTEVNEAFGE